MRRHHHRQPIRQAISAAQYQAAFRVISRAMCPLLLKPPAFSRLAKTILGRNTPVY
jgi:hypothetical protein